jgi:peroxiredoxin family protein
MSQVELKHAPIDSAKKTTGDILRADDPRVKELESRLAEYTAGKLAQEEKVTANPSKATEDKLTLLVFSGEYDKLFAAFVIATGAAAMGTQVTMFFSMWGLNALKKSSKRTNKGKTFLQTVFGYLLPTGSKQTKTSHFNMAGIGPEVFRYMMRKEKIATLEDLMTIAKSMEIKYVTCSMSMQVMGIKAQELDGAFESGGVATFLNEASNSKTTLFI